MNKILLTALISLSVSFFPSSVKALTAEGGHPQAPPFQGGERMPEVIRERNEASNLFKF